RATWPPVTGRLPPPAGAPPLPVPPPVPPAPGGSTSMRALLSAAFFSVPGALTTTSPSAPTSAASIFSATVKLTPLAYVPVLTGSSFGWSQTRVADGLVADGLVAVGLPHAASLTPTNRVPWGAVRSARHDGASARPL